MSFGSLLGRESVTYPACFFEDDDEGDDDESVPLKRGFLWMRRRGEMKLTNEQRALKQGRFDERKSFGGRVMRIMLCGGCCG